MQDHRLKPRHAQHRGPLARNGKTPVTPPPDQAKCCRGLQQYLHALGGHPRLMRQTGSSTRAVHQSVQQPQFDHGHQHLRLDKS